MRKKGRNKKNGFAHTRQIPSKHHPAYYKWIGSNMVEYVTFTEHNPANINGIEVKVTKLSSNIDPKERGKSDSNVVHRVFISDRSSLQKNEKSFRFATNKDREIVEEVFKKAPREEINHSSNSKSNKKNKTKDNKKKK